MYLGFSLIQNVGSLYIATKFNLYYLYFNKELQILRNVTHFFPVFNLWYVASVPTTQKPTLYKMHKPRKQVFYFIIVFFS